MTCYAVIDTNVPVSALLSSHDDAAAVQVVSRLFSGEIIPLFSAEILSEYYEVLHRKKFHFSDELIDTLLHTIDKYGICVEPAHSGEILPDMKDLPFYEVVLEKQEEDAYLVTGNMKHFPVQAYEQYHRQCLPLFVRRKHSRKSGNGTFLHADDRGVFVGLYLGKSSSRIAIAVLPLYG